MMDKILTTKPYDISFPLHYSLMYSLIHISEFKRHTVAL
jgi:hypothetical protein